MDIQKPETDIQKQKTDIQSDAKCAEMRTALGFGSPLLLLICGAHGVHHPGSSVGVCAFFRYLSRRKTRHRVACVELHDHQTLELDLYLEVRQRRLAPSLAVCGPPHMSVASCIDHMHPCHRLGRLSARSIAKNRSMWCKHAFFGSIVETTELNL